MGLGIGLRMKLGVELRLGMGMGIWISWRIYCSLKTITENTNCGKKTPFGAKIQCLKMYERKQMWTNRRFVCALTKYYKNRSGNKIGNENRIRIGLEAGRGIGIGFGIGIGNEN